MNQSHWWILVFVATMVCNGNCRPRDVDVKNVYPVYRSDKQLELETQNRYEKPIKSKPDDGSVAYLRIDIPYKNDYKTLEKSANKNSSKSVIDYVPVALTVKKTNVKKWPSDQNGIETQDDLSLYNIYTNNINPLNLVHATTPGYNLAFPYVTHSKPSILILEELTTPKPFYDYPDSVFTRPVHVYTRPPVPPPMFGEVPHPPFSEQPAYTHLSPQLPSFEPVETTRNPFPAKPVTYPQPDDPNLYYPEPQSPSNGPSSQTPFPAHPHVDHRPEPPNTLPGYPTHVVTPQHPTYVEQSTHHYVSSTLEPETTTKKRKSTKCPNVSIIATSSINNKNGMNKEGCQDISIHIDTNLSNTNEGSSKPAKPVNNVMVQNEQNIQSGIFGIVNAFWSVLSKIFDFSFSGPLLTTLLSPFSAILAGGVSLSAIVLPWLFPQMMSRRKKRPKHKFVILGNSGLKSIKYLYRSIDDNTSYLKRTKRGVGKLQSAYAAWDRGKKISRYR